MSWEEGVNIFLWGFTDVSLSDIKENIFKMSKCLHPEDSGHEGSGDV